MLRGSMLSFAVTAFMGCAGAATVAPPMRPAQAERDLATGVRPDSISAGISEVEFHAGELWMLTDG
jgi:hypothetical protein